MNIFEEAPASKILGTHACWRSLRSASVGRLAVTGRTGPEIFPVNYLPEDGSLIFRTGPGTKLDALLEGGAVALEADGLNPYGTIAWSVVVKGRPEAVPDNELDQDKVDQSLSPWEPGAKDQLFRITPTEITGRQFAINPSARWWSPREP
ncbi:MAG: pyridoxamine 5'-phosphate oxidase family protein [Actinomycetota bacterium]|nr:pyridoxamine 5'-phosphate oxidase family protein [Actinomycetota bacterium]